MSSSLRIAPHNSLALDSRPAVFKLLAVLVGSLILGASSQISVPMIPVPMTMQTFAVTLIGALYGWRLGAVTVIAWLAEAAIGLPVLANGAGGAAHFLGKTGGYLFAFPIAAGLVGWLAECSWNGQRVVMAFWAALAGNALCLVLGYAWLAQFIGWQAAFTFGVAPFLLGGLLKSVLAAATLKAIALHTNKTQAKHS